MGTAELERALQSVRAAIPELSRIADDLERKHKAPRKLTWTQRWKMRIMHALPSL